jgi:ABC-type uncharacterized transport system fused permease/ATPase subunit
MSIPSLLSTDIDDFSKSIVTTFFHIINPLFDTLIIIHKIQRNYSMEGVYGMLLYYISVSLMMSYVRQPTVLFNSNEQSLEGVYHDILNQINTYSEQIASYNHNNNNNNNNNNNYYEYSLVKGKFNSIIEYLVKFARYKLCVNYLDNLFPRYLLMSLVWLLVTNYFHNHSNNSYEKVHNYLRLMTSLRYSISSIILSSKDIFKVIGVSERIRNFDTILNELISNSENNIDVNCGNNTSDDVICRLQNVDIYNNNNQLLIRDLNIELIQGDNLFITGPSGCGKTTLMRYLGGISGPIKGYMVSDMLYIPQNPYILTNSSLIMNIIYPNTLVKPDKELISWLLEQLQLNHLIEKYNLDGVYDYNTILSGGEKQKLQIARVLYNKPKLALLDESTSAVDELLETYIYKLLVLNNITFITVSHHTNIKLYHQKNLKIEQNGSYSLRII